MTVVGKRGAIINHGGNNDRRRVIRRLHDADDFHLVRAHSSIDKMAAVRSRMVGCFTGSRLPVGPKLVADYGCWCGRTRINPETIIHQGGERFTRWCGCFPGLFCRPDDEDNDNEKKPAEEQGE